MSLLLPLGLYLLALVIRLLVAADLPFPTTEPSAYYVGVAQNLVAGEGLVSHGVWSFATLPLEVPKPAFELWLPMSTFVSALGMSVLGSSFWAAQVAGAVLGAAVAPLAWIVGNEAGRVHGLDDRRRRAVAVASGLLAAVLAPLVLASVVPDSAMPFTVFVVVAACLVPRVVGVRDGRTGQRPAPSTAAGIALGAAMGLAYLSRQEVIWLGLTVVLLQVGTARTWAPGARGVEVMRRLGPVVVGGLVVVVPWLIRNQLELGSAFPGQAVENMFLVRNEDIFAFRQRPDAATYLGQGLTTVLTNPLVAAWDNLLSVILLPAFPVGIAGLVSIAGLRRSPALRSPTIVLTLLASGGITFLATVLLFPVATRWGTFMHASGPLLVALTVMAALGGDELMARVSRRRGWTPSNVVLGPVALVAMAGLLAAFQVLVFGELSRSTADRFEKLGVALEAATKAGGERPHTYITDHPMWLPGVTGGYAVALPDEAPDVLVELGRLFDTRSVVVIDERGRYPQALLDQVSADCLASEPLALETGDEPAWLFRLADECDAP